jgi:uncharacterized protein with ParB-like and HNH nuclease domain
MEDVFKPSSLTIKQLFGNTDSLYQIPRYQRAYSWGDDQLDKLWEDLIEAKQNDPNYFLGSVITAKSEDSTTYLDIVDGQQRLTTLTILLCVYRDLFPNINNELLDSDPFAIDNKVIDSSIRFNDRFERLRLRTHSNHQSDFDNIVLNGNTTILKKPTKKDLRNDEPKHKFINSAYFFTNKLKEIGEEEAGSLINYLFNSVKIIRIDCQSVAFAIKLFQVLNDRGLDLTNADLIKSFLIGKIQKQYSSDDELKKQKEDQFMDDWKVCENYSNDTETSLNDLFVMYEYYILAQNPKKSLYDELVLQFSDKDPNQIINNVKLFIENYKREIYERENKLIYSFFYISWGMYWRTILLTALTEKYSNYDEFVKVFRRYYYLNWIAGFTLTKIKQTSFNIIKWLKENRSIEYIKNELDQNMIQNDTLKRATDNLKGDIYYDSWCKPLLFMIEYQQTDDSSLNFFEMSDTKIQVEHILPRAYKSNVDWNSKFVGNDSVDKWINTGANLTLLSGKKNRDASNYSFEKKIIAYNGKGYYADDSEGITAFRITQNIVNQYNENTYSKQWSEQSIVDRWNWFCSQVEVILEIDLSSIKESI